VASIFWAEKYATQTSMKQSQELCVLYAGFLLRLLLNGQLTINRLHGIASQKIERSILYFL
jgi:hypothetical protein